MKLKISGHSDDIVSWELDGEHDEFTLSDRGVMTLLVHSSAGRAKVHAIYDGCWSFALSKVDEEDGDLFPHTRSWKGYTEVLELEVPKGTAVEELDRREDR